MEKLRSERSPCRSRLCTFRVGQSAVNGTETVDYGVRMGVKCPQVIEQLLLGHKKDCLTKTKS